MTWESLVREEVDFALSDEGIFCTTMQNCKKQPVFIGIINKNQKKINKNHTQKPKKFVRMHKQYFFKKFFCKIVDKKFILVYNATLQL